MNYITTAERLGIERGFQQGLQKGIQQGLQQGRKKGEASLLTRQLKHRFNNFPPHYLELIQEADNRTLLKWAERILDADSLDDIFN